MRSRSKSNLSKWQSHLFRPKLALILAMYDLIYKKCKLLITAETSLYSSHISRECWSRIWPKDCDLFLTYSNKWQGAYYGRITNLILQKFDLLRPKLCHLVSKLENFNHFSRFGLIQSRKLLTIILASISSVRLAPQTCFCAYHSSSGSYYCFCAIFSILS